MKNPLKKTSNLNLWAERSRLEQFQALQYAVMSDNPLQIQYRVKEGIDINLTEEDGESNILLYYIQNWTRRAYDPVIYIKVLIDLGVDVNHKRNEHLKMASALGYAVGKKSFEIVKVLIENGAELDIKDINGNTPLWRAVQDYRGESELVQIAQYLIDQGADLDCENNFGHSARSVLLKRNENITDGPLKVDPNWKNWNLMPLLSLPNG